MRKKKNSLLNSALRASTGVMLVALWWIGLWVLLPLARDIKETAAVVLGLILLTIVHGGSTLAGILTDKREYHEERSHEGPGSFEQEEAHTASARSIGRFEFVTIVVTGLGIAALVAYRLVII